MNIPNRGIMYSNSQAALVLLLVFGYWYAEHEETY